MDFHERVEAYLSSQPEPKQADLRGLHSYLLAEFPGSTLWFNDGTNEHGKVVANPTIGYGQYAITYADGSAREYGASIGKASVTGYCIKFRRLAVLNAEVLHAAIRHGMTVDHGS